MPCADICSLGYDYQAFSKQSQPNRSTILLRLEIPALLEAMERNRGR